MKTKLKSGDTVYRIYTGFETEVDSVVVKKITVQKIWFEQRGGLAFQCRTCWNSDAGLYRTPLAAVEAGLKDIAGQVAQLQEEAKALLSFRSRFLK